MILSTNCNNCSGEIVIKPKFTDRLELSKEVGKEFELKCPSCNDQIKYHVDSVKAKIGNFKFIILILILGLSILMFYFLWGTGIISTMSLIIPAGIYIVWYNEENKKVLIFNGHKVGL